MIGTLSTGKCSPSLALLLLLIATMPASLDAASIDSPAMTVFRYASEPGDYIGGGLQETLTAADATITVSGTPAALTAWVVADDQYWSIDLAAPQGEVLTPGKYPQAERATFRTGRSPGLDVSGNHRGCNEVWGQFDIHQIASDSSGAITMLDATFSQRCEASDAPRLTGGLKYRARPLSFSFSSDPGDYIGQGSSTAYSGSTTIFSLTGTGAYLYYAVSGKRDYWGASIAPPTGQRLGVGRFTTARFPGIGKAGLDFYGNGRGCNSNAGTLRITQYKEDNNGVITDFAADFVQHCEGGSAALRGVIRYHD